MAIPSNYIDKITKEGDSRPICPAADKVRVDNENFEADNLDDVLDEVAEAIEDAGGGYNPPAGGIPKTDLAPGVQASLDKADLSASQAELATQIDNVITSTNLALQGKANAADVYDKDTVDDMVAEAGKVKTVSVNGGTPAQPDTNGNVNLVVQAGAQGPKGDKGDTVVLDTQGLPQFTIVNDLVSGGEADALSAEMGRRLAMLSGTYAEAWAHAQAIPYIFPWLWVETIDGDAICKPIWHRGSSNFVDAAGIPISIEANAVPNAPTIVLSVQPTNNEVPKNTIATITPASGSALYYSADGGTTYKVSDRDVSIPLITAGQITIQAYCLNNKGQSTETSLTVSVAGVSVPTFSDPNNAVISRGGYVTITGDKDGTLSYSVNGVAQTPVVGDGVSAPTAQVQITGATTIVAHNTVDGDDSIDVSASYTIAALAAPTLSDPSVELPSTGGTVTITAPTGATGIKYTNDDTDPTTSGTATTVNSTTATVTISTTGTKIRAVAFDAYGDSATEASATYNLAFDGIIVNVSEPVDMLVKLTYQGSAQTVNLSAGENRIPFSDIGGVTSFWNIRFGDSNNSGKTKVISVNFGGATIQYDLSRMFEGCSNLRSCVNLKVGNTYTGSMFKSCTHLERVKLTGKTIDAGSMFMSAGDTDNCSIDITDLKLNGKASTAFYSYRNTGTIDISGWDTTSATDAYSMFTSCKATKLIIGNFAGTGFYSSVAQNIFNSSSIEVVRCTTAVPPAVDSGNNNWLAMLYAVAGNNMVIEVPSAYLADYQNASVWSDYSQYMTTY